MLTFELQSSEATRKYWPHDFTLLARFKVAKPVKSNWKRMASLQPHPRSTAILTLATSPTLRSADSAIGLLIKLTTLKKVSWPAVYKPFRTVPIAFTSILKHVA
ncbi:Aldose 1-epimerase family protein YeaD [Salmonella enterica subsp. enterica]|uniref:Aldose 1-epimerase family protein YeaD n=1 Tax=Salmonella enterica I TaxID=59201 RepID=A0A379WV17_SALET|nr:Aldose 1-epimerase family protein YeaD [Salmonella enterica subsp. enterica]